jgi:hypothetical protein
MARRNLISRPVVSLATRRKWTMKVDHVETGLQTHRLDRPKIAFAFGDLGDLGDLRGESFSTFWFDTPEVDHGSRPCGDGSPYPSAGQPETRFCFLRSQRPRVGNPFPHPDHPIPPRPFTHSPSPSAAESCRFNDLVPRFLKSHCACRATLVAWLRRQNCLFAGPCALDVLCTSPPQIQPQGH